MKISALFISALFLASLCSNVRAQADCDYQLRVYVRDGEGNTIKNAKLKLNDWKEFFYRDQFNGYETSGLRAVGAPAWTPNLKVSAKGFKTFNYKLNISCAQYEFLLTLRPKGSKADADFKPITDKDSTIDKQ